MYFVPSDHRKESLAITSALFAALLLLLFVLNFPLFKETTIVELEGGGGGGDIEVNFGDSDVGQGTNFANTEHVEEVASAATSSREQEEALVTNDNDEENTVAVAETRKPKEEPKKPVEKPAEAPKPKPSSAALAAINAANSKSNSGDGNDGIAGNKGKPYGSTTAGGYNGGGGSGGGTGSGDGTGDGPGSGSGSGGGSGGGKGRGVGDYQLGGRKPLTRPQPAYDCNEQGTVVVSISVDRSGRVIEATPGARGTTNTAQCLTAKARSAALQTKFEAKEDAPDKQVGKIIYNFKLTD